MLPDRTYWRASETLIRIPLGTVNIVEVVLEQEFTRTSLLSAALVEDPRCRLCRAIVLNPVGDVQRAVGIIET